MCTGLGLMGGPLLASIIVIYLDYAYTLIFFACLIGGVGIPIAICLPSRLNNSIKDVASGEVQVNIPWCLLLSELRTVMVTLTATAAAITLVFFDPILTLRLDEFGLSESNFGQTMAGICFSYTLGAIIIGFGFSGKFDARTIITGCFVLVAIGIFLTSGYPT